MSIPFDRRDIAGMVMHYGVGGTEWPTEPGWEPPSFVPILPPVPVATVVAPDPIHALMTAWVEAKARKAEARDAADAADAAEVAAFAALTQALAAAREP